MRSPSVGPPGHDPADAQLADVRPARVRIRGEALRLFADRGVDGVSVRDIAASAGVSPALVIKHFGSKEGLHDAVDQDVAAAIEAMLAQVTDPAAAEPGTLPTLAEAVAQALPDGSPVPRYLGRMLIDGGPAGAGLFASLYGLAQGALDRMVRGGTASPGSDPGVRAAFLLVNDLAVLILRKRLTEALGEDPLSAPGMARWGAEVLEIYRHGLVAPSTGPGPTAQTMSHGGRP
jgi:AcrR family transcriptional regulator